MNLVVGSTGLLGMEICRQLTAAGQPARALVRTTSEPGKRAELESLGVELAAGDLKDPASLRRACAGVTAVISTASSTFSRQAGDSIKTVDEEGQLALIDAAKGAGVEHFVFVSFRENPLVQYPLSAAKRAVERRLMTSGMAYTILQASYFMEVWLTPNLGFDATKGSARIYGDGMARIRWVSYKDVARIAVAALHVPAARNTVLNVGGPQALSPREVVRTFEAAGAAEFEVEYVPVSALAEQFQVATDPMQKSFCGLMLQYAQGDDMDTEATSALFPFQHTSVRDYVSTLLAHA